MIGKWKSVFTVLSFLTASTLFAAPPVHYVENKNQWPAGFHYSAEFPGARVFLKDRSLYFIQYRETSDDDKSLKPLQTELNEGHVHGPAERSLTTFELTFLNALTPSIVASDRQPTLYNYYLGNDPSIWGQGAHSYSEVFYKGMYDGIDMRVYSEPDRMKYDWIVSPCADPRKIVFTYKGIEHLDLVNENLVIKSKLGEMTETKPFAYQVINGERRVVPAAFDIDDGHVSFVFPNGYDVSYELVIDPELIFSSYSGSTMDNWGNTATPDSHGNLYSGGMVSTIFGPTGFPVTPGAYQTTHNGGNWDVGILKYDSVGATVLYVTFLGGSGAETPQSLVVNNLDQLLVLGATSSTNFPGTTVGSFKGGTEVTPLSGLDYTPGTDLFIARFNANGSQLLAARYLGGTENDGINFVAGSMGTNVGKVESPLSRNYGDELRGDIITDANNFIYVASNTMSDDFPVVNPDPNAAWHGGTHDGFVAKLTPTLSIVWTRLIGGDSTDTAFSIKIGASGNVFVGGGTVSANLAGMDGLHTTMPGKIDGWIAELSPAGDKIIHGTYVGTSEYDQVYFIDLAVNGDVLAYGQTRGQYPVAPAGKVYFNNNGGQFLHRFSPDLKTTVFSTVFGKGSNRTDISPTAFLVNNCDNIYMAGWGGNINATTRFGVTRNYLGGNTFGLPTTPDALQKTSLAGNDFYFIILSQDASELVYATFLGGSSSSTHVDGGTSRFDKKGVVYHAVCASCGGADNDFPSFNVPASRAQNRSDNCNNAAFKFDLASLRAAVVANARVCLPDGITFENESLGGETFEWYFGDGEMVTTTTKSSVFHKYTKPGRYTAFLKTIDLTTCIGIDTATIVVDVFQPNMKGGPDQDLCFGSSSRLEASGAVSYSWRTADNSFTSNLASPMIAPEKTTTYFVNMTDANGCTAKDTVNVKVVPGVDVKFDYERFYNCHSRPDVKVQNLSELKAGETSAIYFGDGNSSEEKEVTHVYEQDGIYKISVQAVKEFCVYEVSEEVRVVTLKIPNVITPGAEDDLNDVFKLEYGNPPMSRVGLDIGVKIMNRWGKKVFEAKNYQDDWSGDDVDAGVYYYEVDIRGEIQCKGWIHLIK